jgi:hypothetical protein
LLLKINDLTCLIAQANDLCVRKNIIAS